MMHFFSMGGYAAYVWPSFGGALLVLAYNIVKPYYEYCVIIKELRAKIDTHHASHS